MLAAVDVSQEAVTRAVATTKDLVVPLVLAAQKTFQAQEDVAVLCLDIQTDPVSYLKVPFTSVQLLIPFSKSGLRETTGAPSSATISSNS